MHERKTLVIRNPQRPTLERLPCRLSREERYARMERRMACERTIAEHDAQIEALKAAAKKAIAEVQDRRDEIASESVALRDQILDGHETRSVECELLEDRATGHLYVYRLDTGEVCQRRDMAPHERDQPDLPLDAMPTRTVHIPDGIDDVVRFDSDPPSVGAEAESAKSTGGNGSTYGHEHEYDDGACMVCGEVDPDAAVPEPETKPRRRRKGEGKTAKAQAPGWTQ